MNTRITRTARAVFLDRDGTLNEEKSYVHDWKDWRWLPGVREGLARLQKMDYKLVIASNQSGIARGYYNAGQLRQLHARINEDLIKYGAQITAFYHCPHHPDYTGDCSCRKPKPGMLLKAAGDLKLNLDQCWIIGDKASDAQAGIAAGCRPILLETGYGAREKNLLGPGIPVCENFSEAVDLILSSEENTHA